MVKARGRHEPAQGSESPVEIRVYEEAPHGAGQNHQQRHRIQRLRGGLRQPHHIERNESAKASENHVHRMRAGIDQPVHFFRAVVDGVETPQKRDFVRPAVPPIEADLTHHQRRPESHRQRQGRGARLQAPRDHEMQSPTDGCHR